MSLRPINGSDDADGRDSPVGRAPVDYRRAKAKVAKSDGDNGRYTVCITGGHLRGHWTAASRAEAGALAEVLELFDRGCEWVAHRITLVPENHFDIRFANGGYNPGWVDLDGSVTVQQAPDFDEWELGAHIEANWWGALADGLSVLDRYPDVEAFITAVFGREYYLAATDERVTQAARELGTEDEESDIRHLLLAAVARVAAP